MKLKVIPKGKISTPLTLSLVTVVVLIVDTIYTLSPNMDRYMTYHNKLTNQVLGMNKTYEHNRPYSRTEFL